MKIWSANHRQSNLEALGSTDIVPVNSIEAFTPSEGDLVVFLGGADIAARMYGHTRVDMSGAKSAWGNEPQTRDILEMRMIYRCIENGIRMAGFCRGAQMLCIAAGGTLVQHIDNHTSGDHPLILHNGKIIQCNSVHHQMMRLKGVEHTLLGWAPNLSKRYFVDPVDPVIDNEFVRGEPEIVHFPLIRAIGFQYHPEYDFQAPAGRLAVAYINQYLFGRI